MSRYTFTGNRPCFRIVVGWDRPLETYFAQVWDGGELETGDLLLWAGAGVEPVPTVAALAELLAPFGTLPEDIVGQLHGDKCERSGRVSPFDLLMSRR
ncbi:MAG: hypothetical protein U0871_15405 [Gemmataceae bacterium]